MEPVIQDKKQKSCSAATGAPLVLVPRIGEAAGSLAAAAALTCAASSEAIAPLLIDLGGRRPRPTLLMTPAARALEGQLAKSLACAQVAGRGGFCQLALPADRDGIVAALAAVAFAGGAPVIVHFPEGCFSGLLEGKLASRALGAMICTGGTVDTAASRPVVVELLGRGYTVSLLDRRPSWLTERRALFGGLRLGDLHELPQALTQWLASAAHCRAGIAAAVVA